MINDLHISRGPAAAFIAMGLFWGAFAALVPDIKGNAGLSDGHFGVVMLISSLGAMLSMWLAPWADMRLGRMALPVVTAFVALFAVLPGVGWNGVTLAAGMILVAVAMGTMDVVMNARVSAFEAESGRSLMNLNHGLYSMAYALSAVVTGLARSAGWGPFGVLACVSVLTFVFAVLIAFSPVPKPVADEEHSDTTLPWALIVPAGVIVLLAFLSEQATEGWSALHLERAHNASPAQSALGPALLGLTMGIGRLSGQVVAQHMSERVVITWGAALAAVGAIIAAYAPSLALAYIGFALLGTGLSVTVPMSFAWVGKHLPAKQRAYGISRLSVIGYAGFFMGPPIMGFVSEAAGLSASFTVIAVLMVIVPVVLVPLTARNAR
jgi:MFS family permease